MHYEVAALTLRGFGSELPGMLDFDASCIEEEKKYSEWMYTGERGNSENRHKEIKADLHLDRLPCGGERGRDANRIYAYACGVATDESDVDLLVVAESDLPRHKRSRELYRMIRPHRFAMDILVYTPQEMRSGATTPVSFVSQILREGKPVYVR